MSITRALLEPSPLRYKPLISRPLEFSLITTTPTFRPTKPLKYSPIKSHLIIPSKTTPSQNPLEGFFNTIFKTLKPITKPATTAILIGVLLALDFNSAALAASAGRIGGSSFSSSRSSSSSSSSSSNSRSYSSSGGSSSWFSDWAPDYGGGRVDKKQSSSWSSDRAPDYGGGRVDEKKSSSRFSHSAQDYGGGRVDVKPSSCSRSDFVPRGSSSGSSVEELSEAKRKCSSSGSSEEELSEAQGKFTDLCFAFICCCFAVYGIFSDRDGEVFTAPEKTSVLKLQVGLSGTGKALQRDLNRIAEVADTSSRKGLSYVLTEASLALIRHPDYRVSAYSSVDVKRSIEDGEKCFNQLSIEERGKVDEETLVNVDNIKRQSTGNRKSSDSESINEYIVITILVAAEGVFKLPRINGGGDLKEALQKLAAIPTSKLLAVEVLWTPQDENDTLSESEFLEDYPLLRPL